MEGHDVELTTEELVEQQKEETVVEQTSSKVEKTSKEPVFTRELKEICKKWAEAKTFDTDIMSQFQGILKSCQKQQTMDSFLVKRSREDCSGAAAQPSSSS
ncbi:hypothetical protein JRQ81_014664 [Phrynocephalus forsythii]|uniref:Uncharacterized protein n=1 Tax=Phrynocephalus forsythii TaxID=171643 RepID=A0A9Q0XX40_9SAUR|nr:hypothetical protein JRQ81_014664 [Phrynocephalus forsythii]